jgi:hypothetical protein
MLLHGAPTAAELAGTDRRAPPPSPVKHDVAAEALAAFRDSTAAMAAQNEKLKQVQKAIRDYRSELFWHKQLNGF